MGKTDNRFIFNLPDGWEDETVYIFEGPEDDGISHRLTLNIDHHLQHDDIKKFASEKTSAMTETMQHIEVLKDKEITADNGNPAYEFIFKWVPTEEKIFFYKFVFIIKNGRGFSFSSMFSKKTIKTIGRQVNSIIESLIPGTFQAAE